MNVTELAEKPTLDCARQHLRVEGLGEDEFLSLLGLYVLTPAFDRLRREEGMTGCVIQRERYDVGMPDSYREALIGFGRPAGEE